MTLGSNIAEGEYVRIDDVGPPRAKWLERGHPPATFDLQRFHTIWNAADT